jgi:hydrogenase maturation protein HypF
MNVVGRRIAVRGVVQGVGFRPWVYRLARQSGVAGRVRNDAAGVTIEVFGADQAVSEFVARLGEPPPAPGAIRELAAVSIPAEDVCGFVIEHSEGAEARGKALSIPPDLATCPACLAELLDPADRRHRYPFINCTSCGPRFTISLGVPYDRPVTTMARFTMCPACQAEYDDPGDRRFHAQPDACPECGPRLELEADPRVSLEADADPLVSAALALRAGLIVAVKGLGGYHLACDATCDVAVRRLRERKRREEKPFAVMVRDLEEARRLAVLSPVEEALLSGVERPIVLVTRRSEAPLAPSVAPDTPLVGLFLAYTPLHHLLLTEARRPLVMTSANLTDEPIAATEEEVARLAGIWDLRLGHDRAIASRCDDSVAQVIAGAPSLIRRSRGWVPRAVPLRQPVPRPILAVGAQLKNTFCLAVGDSAYLGPHVGDLDSPEAYDFFQSAVERMERLVQVTPEVIAHDLHPDYLSTRYALARPGRERIAVQHHHAHVASAMAEHGLDGPVLGVAYDGSGLGTDGAAWGGEIFLADRRVSLRLATWRPLRLAGGDAAVRNPWRLALALLDDAFDGDAPAMPVFAAVPARDRRLVGQLLRSGVNAPPAHGLGRLFDAVGALALRRPRSAYEGQIAVAWTHAAQGGGAPRPYPFAIEDRADPWVIDPRPMTRALVDDLRAGIDRAEIAARFHHTIVAATATVLRRAVAERGALPVVATGGCFANRHLAEGLVAALRGELDVKLQRAVPPGDGGIALGQAAIAAWRS